MSDAAQAPFSILIVDDDEMSRNRFARAIRGYCRVHVARGADEVMTMLGKYGAEIAILVTDFRMPGRDGDDLLRDVVREYPQTCAYW